jgi:hypothetical protein
VPALIYTARVVSWSGSSAAGVHVDGVQVHFAVDLDVQRDVHPVPVHAAGACTESRDASARNTG